MKIVGGQITGCSRLRPAADAGHYVQAGNSVALLQPAFANFGFTKQSLTKDCSQPEAEAAQFRLTTVSRRNRS